MAKFELPIYDTKTGEIVKTHQRGFMPVDLFIRFQNVAEEVTADKFKSNEELFDALEDLFVELFPDLTKEEYRNGADVAEIMKVWQIVNNKSTDIESGNSKNG